MKTYLIPESNIEAYRQQILAKDISCVAEVDLMLSILGYEEIEMEDAKKIANIGDCLLVTYDNKRIPMQVIHKYDDGRVVLQSYYLLEQRAFDQNTNVYKDAEIRQYLNGDFLKKFDSEFVDMLKTTDVHTDNYVTHDKMWLLSHEEIGYSDDSNMFKPNVGSITYDYYKTHIEEFKETA